MRRAARSLKLAAAAALGVAGAAGAVGAVRFPAPRAPQTSPAGPFDVVGHGADPSGATDSAAAIQRAIDAAAQAGGGVVAFPSGTFACRRPLVADRSAGGARRRRRRCCSMPAPRARPRSWSTS